MSGEPRVLNLPVWWPLNLFFSPMFTRELLAEMLRHMEWADARVWSAVPEDSPADARLKQWLVHIHVVQRAFFSVWTGADLAGAFRTPDDFASLADVRAWARAYYPGAHEFIHGLTAERL